MNLTLPFQLLALAAALAFAMAATHRVQLRRRDAGLVDAVWSGSFAAVAVFLALTTPGDPARRVLIAVLVATWSLRLAAHLVADRLTGEVEEDGRYRRLREEKGDDFPRWLFWFDQAQGLSVVLLAIPLRLALANETPLGPLDLVAAALIVTSIAGESIADRQLARFRRDPANRGRVCRDGLWRYSRHPNYFFEWLHWLAYPLWAFGAPYGAVAWLAPAAMLLLILKVTGVPPTEEQALRSRGEAYRDYQRTTNAFFPWFPREDGAAAPSPRENAS